MKRPLVDGEFFGVFEGRVHGSAEYLSESTIFTGRLGDRGDRDFSFADMLPSGQAFYAGGRPKRIKLTVYTKVEALN